MLTRVSVRFLVRAGHETTYRKVASSNTSRLEAHTDFFQIAYEGDF